MKKLTLGLMTAFVLFLINPDHLKADTKNNKVPTTILTNTTVKSNEVNSDEIVLNEIKAIDVTTLNSSEKKELLKESGTLQNEQGRHGRGYHERRSRRDVDVSIRADRGRHYGHGGAYIGGGGVLILILILILVL